jgi:acetoin:2,6-dichlorophenolindophenol oxidoreductase subunit beta
MARMSYMDASKQALREEMRRDPTVWVLGEDISMGGNSGQYLGLLDQFPASRFVDTAISEAAIAGAGVGAAMAGTRPVIELRMSDFALCAADEIVNQAAKARYMLGGQVRMPLVARLPTGIVPGYAAQHSQCLEAWWAHIPGLVVVTPATPADNKGLLKSAIRSDDPIIYMEHKTLWRVEGEVDEDPEALVPFGKCRVARPGTDLTIVAWSGMVRHAEAAADILASQESISAEVIDLRTVWPWDEDGVSQSVEKTGHLLIVHEAVQAGGFGAEIYATMHSRLGGRIKRVERIGGARIPIPFSTAMNPAWQLEPPAIVASAKRLLSKS